MKGMGNATTKGLNNLTMVSQRKLKQSECNVIYHCCILYDRRTDKNSDTFIRVGLVSHLRSFSPWMENPDFFNLSHRVFSLLQ